MGKKFITILSKSTKYRLYSSDIKSVYQKRVRKIPPVPQFDFCNKDEQTETDHFQVDFEEITTET